uniref:Uncharacterized protein LOC100176143 n=1 Tax=Phallusia mammillata TaxID=59560 RepID=A0A6F9DFV0_9ASCI|nr:uncharacterized protein LOC100176143 [Phallusia mammillata]
MTEATNSENAVAVKLPTFWTAQPRVWFQQAEAQIALKSIKGDLTKYYYVVSALDQDTANRLIDLLENPPEADKYETIKARLVETFCLSRPQRAMRLLHMPPLGDRMPSALMDDMLALLGDAKECFVFQQLFLERLPEYIRTRLSGEEISESRLLARKADAIWSGNQTPTEPALSNVRRNGFSPDQHKKRGRKSRSASPQAMPDSKSLCFYHRRFGRDAIKCRHPCALAQQGNEEAGHP